MIQLVSTAISVWAEVRCFKCGRLLFKWHPSGISAVNVKCPRCGGVETMRLSTG